MSLAEWDIILGLITLVFMICAGLWLKNAIDRQLKSRQRSKYRKK
jgi:FtsZ-interacting cell division protein ZipA